MAAAQVLSELHLARTDAAVAPSTGRPSQAKAALSPLSGVGIHFETLSKK